MSSVDGEHRGLVSVREVAQQLGVHPETIRRLIHDGRLEAVRVGRVLRVHREAVDGFLAGCLHELRGSHADHLTDAVPSLEGHRNAGDRHDDVVRAERGRGVRVARLNRLHE